MGGGGSSGGVSFPDHITNFHDGLLGAQDPSGTSGFITLDNAMASAFGNDPYSGLTPATTGHLEDTVDQWPADVQADIKNLDEVADWKNQLSEAVTEIINNNLLDNLDPHANLAGNAESGADTNITKAQNSINTGVSPETDWQSFVDTVVNDIQQDFPDTEINLGTDEVDARIAADNELGDALTAALDQVGVTPNTDWADKVDEAISKVDNSQVLEDIDMASAISAAQSDADQELQQALDKASNFVQGNLINPVVNEFEQEVNSRLDARKRSVSSLYADVNAVHSSSFLISQALLERDAQREVNNFDAETRLEMYREAFQAHLQGFQQNLEVRAQEQLQESQQRLEFITQGAQIMAELLSQKISFEESAMSTHAQAYSQRMNQEAQAKTELEATREQTLNQQINTISEILAQKIQYEQTFMELHVEAFARRLQAYLEAEARNKRSDDQLVGQGVQQMLQTSRQDAELLINERTAFQQAAASDFEARQAAEEFSTSLDEKSALWELQVHTQGSNILAAPSGMAARVPPQKSDTSKAIGGALTGGTAGAKAGTAVGGPVGGAIGAGVGALLGAASGAL